MFNMHTKLEVSGLSSSRDIRRAKNLKLAPYGTDGRLFATNISAKFEVTWHKIESPARSNLDIVPWFSGGCKLPL